MLKIGGEGRADVIFVQHLDRAELRVEGRIGHLAFEGGFDTVRA